MIIVGVKKSTSAFQFLSALLMDYISIETRHLDIDRVGEYALYLR